MHTALGSLVAAGCVTAAALPTCLWLHRGRPIQRGDPTAIMEQMWSRTGVLPSALLEVARFDSSLDLVRVPSGSALQQHAPVLRTTSYPYGLPCGLCEERQRGRCSGCAQRRLLALTRTLTVVLVTCDAGMVRRARQVASGRFCSERSARSLFVLRKSSINFGKKIEL